MYAVLCPAVPHRTRRTERVIRCTYLLEGDRWDLSHSLPVCSLPSAPCSCARGSVLSLCLLLRSYPSASPRRKCAEQSRKHPASVVRIDIDEGAEERVLLVRWPTPRAATETSRMAAKVARGMGLARLSVSD